MSIKDFCYTYFKPIGRGLLGAYKGLEDNMEAANMKIHPEVYLSIVSFLTIIASPIPVIFLFLIPKFFPNLLSTSTSFFNPYYLIVFSPVLILLIGLILPKILAVNRISRLKVEIPYASMYMSVMASGGLSPYRSLLRIGRMKLLPKLRDEIKRIQSLVLGSALDPVSAMEKAAKVIGLREYKELLLGYASTLRTGGDVLHYLYSQTEAMFRSMAAKIKAMGESMAILMEAYTIIGILGSLGLYMMFVVSFAIPDIGMTISPEVFFLFAFILLPFTSIAFMYIGERLQVNYPVSNKRTYIVLGATLPFGLLLITQTVFPFFPNAPNMLIFPFLRDFISYLQSTLGFMDGSKPALGLALSLIITSIPITVSEHLYSKEEGGILQGVTSFLRDLVETRKTGLSPEKCIQVLSKRDYGRFSKQLKIMSSELSWGFSLRKIFEDFCNKTKNWLSQVNMYLLIDTIEVGGGTESLFFFPS
jgi:flagellar protein FlaJ